MNLSSTWTCPITGEILMSGMTKGELLGADSVIVHSPRLFVAGLAWHLTDEEKKNVVGAYELRKGNRWRLIPVSADIVWCWEFVEAVRRIMFTDECFDMSFQELIEKLGYYREMMEEKQWTS